MSLLSYRCVLGDWLHMVVITVNMNYIFLHQTKKSPIETIYLAYRKVLSRI